MTLLAAFEVLGVPAPQGSKTRMPNGAMIEGSSATGRAKTRAWRSSVSEAARDLAGNGPPFDGPLSLTIAFRLPMPASRPKPARVLGWWPHFVKPDIDKLIRATLDGLTDGGLIRDDARVCKLCVESTEVVGWTGAEIQVQQYTNHETT